MDCKECKKLIPAFITDSLNYKRLVSYLDHVDKCMDCKEELTIQILISEGMLRLEEGNAFDLQDEITKKMQAAKKKIKIHKILINVRVTLELFALVAIGVLIVFFLL
ncbi:MAG TPA: hypothetical protein VJY54_09170 [Lachnospiraceae bacterium]|nr:hypothetical protein [Lachnospiraceae bacterium]